MDRPISNLTQPVAQFINVLKYCAAHLYTKVKQNDLNKLKLIESFLVIQSKIQVSHDDKCGLVVSLPSESSQQRNVCRQRIQEASGNKTDYPLFASRGSDSFLFRMCFVVPSMLTAWRLIVDTRSHFGVGW